MALNLVHLSDIHFKYELDGSVHDLDYDVRNELEIDLRHILDETGPIDAIVVTGDIAFAGKEEDYDVARAWLASLCEKIGCKAEQVWVVPGNHDINWQGITPIVRNVQDSIQGAAIDSIDRCIRQVVHEDPIGADVLATPLTDYYKFSAIYGCKPNSGHLSWQDDLRLGFGYTLRLVGLNSAIVSNKDDDQEDRKLVVGLAQITMPREQGRLYLTLCHHPVSWLKDGQEVSARLNRRASLQLYGHEHERALEHVGNTLIVQAGALQPERENDSPWCPAYNVLNIEVDASAAQHKVCVTAFPRVWSADHCFSADPSLGGMACLHYSLLIDPDVQLNESPVKTNGHCTPRAPNGVEGAAEQEEVMASPERQLVYGYLTLGDYIAKSHFMLDPDGS